MGLSEGHKQRLLRFNVNGIDLDPPAFARLQNELVMHKVRLQSRSGNFHFYYAGRFIDRQGTSHWLIVREAPVKVLTGENTVVDPQHGVEYFYEVITDSVLMERVKTKLRYRPTDSAPQTVS